MILSDDMPGDIYQKSSEFVELLESKLGVSGITLSSTWTDPLDAWGIVIDRSTSSVTETVGSVLGRLTSFSYFKLLRPITLFIFSNFA